MKIKYISSNLTSSFSKFEKRPYYIKLILFFIATVAILFVVYEIIQSRSFVTISQTDASSAVQSNCSFILRGGEDVKKYLPLQCIPYEIGRGVQLVFSFDSQGNLSVTNHNKQILHLQNNNDEGDITATGTFDFDAGYDFSPGGRGSFILQDVNGDGYKDLSVFNPPIPRGSASGFPCRKV